MIIHLIHSPVSAKRFVEPLIFALASAGFNVELWLENRADLANFADSITCSKRFIEFDLTGNPFQIIKRIVGLGRLFKKLKPSAIHTHQSRASFIPLLAAFFARIPVRIYHNHGAPYLGYSCPKQWLFWLLEFINCCLATNVLVVSPAILDRMTRDKIVSKSKPKSVCLGQGSICGIDLDEFNCEKFNLSSRQKSRRALSISDDAFVVLYVGRPFKRKGFHNLLRSWQLFRDMSSKADVILLTAGCSFQDISDAFGSCPTGVIPLGYVTDVIPYYAASDAVTLPSLHEGMPYSLLEAAAAVRTLVATDIVGINSLIEHNHTGLLVEPENPVQLAQTFERLRNDGQLRRRLAENARSVIEKFFDRNTSKKLLIQYYNAIGLRPEKVVGV